MISSLLERLEAAGGGSVSTLDPGRPRPTGPGRVARRGRAVASSSGRLRSAFQWIAERSDDGVFVAPRVRRGDGSLLVDGPEVESGGDPSSSAERIVWVGDLEVSRPGKGHRPPSDPVIEFDRDGQGVTIRWSFPEARADAGQHGSTASYRLRVTVPCRPVNEVTFVNDVLDPDVWAVRTRGGSQALRMRPYPSLPEIEFGVEGCDLELESAPEWNLGVNVCDIDGRPMGEDRFSPGAFLVTRPSGADSLALRIRVAPGRGTRLPGWRGLSTSGAQVPGFSTYLAPGQVVSGGRVAPLSAESVRMGAMILPGQCAMDGGLMDVKRRAALRTVLLDAAPFISGARFDVALWAARTAYLLQPDPTKDVTSVTFAFLRRIVQRIDVAWKSTGCPGAAGSGLPRFCGEDSAPTAPGAIPIEYAALMHQACAQASRFAAALGDGEMEAVARGHAARLKRWFQEAYWLKGPERAADLAWEFERPDRAQQLSGLALRPHMLLAASLPEAPLTRGQRGLIVRSVESRLLTATSGLCTLDPDDPGHTPTSLGDGAAWPWLLGPFVEATLLAFGSDRARRRALGAVLDGAGLGEAPMAWASGGVPASLESTSPPSWGAPLGTLFYALNQTEEARARGLLSRCPIEMAS